MNEQLAAPPEIRAILDRRQALLRDESQAREDETVVWVAELTVGRERYAIPLESLRGAVPLASVTPVPLSPPHVIGIVRFQGRIVTAYSLAALLAAGGFSQDPSVLLVVDLGGERLVAFDCERVPVPLAVPLARVAEAQARGAAASIEIATEDLVPLRLLDPARLLASPEARRGH